MSDFSVFVYMQPNKRGVWAKFQFEKQSDGFYQAEYNVNENGNIGVRINPKTRKVEVYAVHGEYYVNQNTKCVETLPLNDGSKRIKSILKTDILPYDLNIKDETAFGMWLDDCIENWWFALVEADDMYDGGDEE